MIATWRWHWLGAVNEPCFNKPMGPDPQRFGLWLDVRRKDCPPDPFEDETKYPGVKVGARGQPIGRGKILPVGSYYGYPSGIVGLRLFPNPDFDETAAENWDAEKYYTDEKYFNDPNLSAPIASACHAGSAMSAQARFTRRPTRRIRNGPTSTRLSALSICGVTGGSFIRPTSRIFFYQAIHSYPPGTLDTSLESTDYIVNPRTMNAIYNLGARLNGYVIGARRP